MNNLMIVRVRQGVRDLDAIVDGLIERKTARGQQFRQRPTLHELHHEILEAVLATDLVKGADIGMVERRSRPRF